MYKLLMQQYSQRKSGDKIAIFVFTHKLTKLPFLFLHVNFHTSYSFLDRRTLNGFLLGITNVWALSSTEIVTPNTSKVE